jgi:hypothetical protein
MDGATRDPYHRRQASHDGGSMIEGWDAADQATTGARSPEELELLFEDALLLRDGALLAALFAEGAVLAADGGPPGRGGAAITELALALWPGDPPYVADPRRIVQARDLALIVAEQAISVARRGCDGSWRYVIAIVSPGDAAQRRNHGPG